MYWVRTYNTESSYRDKHCNQRQCRFEQVQSVFFWGGGGVLHHTYYRTYRVHNY